MNDRRTDETAATRLLNIMALLVIAGVSFLGAIAFLFAAFKPGNLGYFLPLISSGAALLTLGLFSVGVAVRTGRRP